MVSPDQARDAAAASVKVLLAAKVAQRVALDAEIAALQEVAVGDQPDTALALYCSLDSVRATVKMINALGWRLPGQKGPRQWKREDVYELVTQHNPQANPALASMALGRLAQRTSSRPFAGWSP